MINLKKIHIICPICSKNKRILIPEDIFEIDEGSLLKYPINQGIICSHQFILVLDYNFSIRDYEIPKSSIVFKTYFNKTKEQNLLYDFSLF